MPDVKTDEVLDLETMMELTTAAQFFAIAPIGKAWANLERAALMRAIARVRMTGERARTCADVLILLEQLADDH